MKTAVAALLLASASLLCPPIARAELMQAIVVSGFGPPDVLEPADVPRPQPAAGELVVRVHAAAVNPVDGYIRAGRTGGFIDVELPYVPGFDLSGVVEAVGDGVDGFAVGDAVFAMLELTRGGAYAQYARVKAHEVAPKPARLSHVEAAALPLVALTAWQALVETAALEAGQTVLIHGGSGGVGSVAIQLAKARGARVAATASAGNLDTLRALGADIAIDYRNQRFEDHVDRVDVVLDLVGGSTQQRSLEVLADGGVLVSLVGLTDAARQPPRGLRAVAMLVRPDQAQLRRIAELVERGDLRAEVSLQLTLDQARQAHEQIATGHTRGKVVLVVDGH